MSNFRHFKVEYLHMQARTPKAERDSVNSIYFINKEVIPGLDERHAIRQVMEIGGIPLRVSRTFIWMRGLSDDYRIKFLVSLLFGVQNGQSAGTVLEHLIEAESWPLREKLEPALKVLKAGAKFSEAVAILGVFDESTISMLEAGEQTGSLKQSIAAAVKHLEKKNTSDALLKAAATAIGVDILIALSSVISSRFFLLPSMKEQGFKNDDPAVVEEWNKALDIAFVGNDILMIVTSLGIGYLLWMWGQYHFGDQDVRRKISMQLVKVPFLGPSLLHAAMGASTGVMAHLIKGGVMFLQGAEITARGAHLPQARDYWETSAKQVAAGQELQKALALSPMSIAEQRILSSHGNRDQLAEAFANISDYRQKQAEQSNKRFIVAGLISSLLYSCVGIALMLYVNWVQIRAVMSTSTV